MSPRSHRLTTGLKRIRREISRHFQVLLVEVEVEVEVGSLHLYS